MPIQGKNDCLQKEMDKSFVICISSLDKFLFFDFVISILIYFLANTITQELISQGTFTVRNSSIIS